MTELVVSGLVAEVAGHEVLHGIDLRVKGGEVHAVMGPNGSGKTTLAHALMGRPGTVVKAGSILLDGHELVGLATWERARLGLFLALQRPVEVPGVDMASLLGEALHSSSARSGTSSSKASDGFNHSVVATAEVASAEVASAEVASAEVATGGAAALSQRLQAEARQIGFDERLLARSLNVDLSGGERKRSETVQLGVLRPAIAVLDEIDSGLDVDALGVVARRLELATTEWNLGVLAITHFRRLLAELRADTVHVLVDGRIVATGGSELARELETTGYRGFADPRSVGDRSAEDGNP